MAPGRRALLASAAGLCVGDAATAATEHRGRVLLLRHAHAPGFGDPPGARAGACETQRNLDAAGRAQAARIGDGLRAAGVHAPAVWHAERCRCRDTAMLLGFPGARHEPALDSLFEEREQTASRTALLRARIAAHADGWPLILVTHQVNITALTGLVPRSGEGVHVLAADPGRPIGTLPPL